MDPIGTILGAYTPNENSHPAGPKAQLGWAAVGLAPKGLRILRFRPQPSPPPPSGRGFFAPNGGAACNLYRADLGRRGHRAAISGAPRIFPGPAFRACHGHRDGIGGSAIAEPRFRAVTERLSETKAGRHVARQWHGGRFMCGSRGRLGRPAQGKCAQRPGSRWKLRAARSFGGIRAGKNSQIPLGLFKLE